MKRVLLALAVFAGAAGLLVSCSSGHDCHDGGHGMCAEPCEPVVVKKSVTTTTTTTEACEDAGCGHGGDCGGIHTTGEENDSHLLHMA